MSDDHARAAARRVATFVWQGRVFEVDLDTKVMNCPQCGLRFFLPHDLLVGGDGLATVSPSVVCPEQHGGCGWHVVIQRGNAV